MQTKYSERRRGLPADRRVLVAMHARIATMAFAPRHDAGEDIIGFVRVGAEHPE